MSKRQREEELVEDEAVAAASHSSRRKITLLDRIVAAIRALRSPSGSSSQALLKMMGNFKGSPTSFKNTLKRGVDMGILVKRKNSYLVAGDPPYEDLTDKVSIDDIAYGGEGEGVKLGDTCTISYIGTLQSSGCRFDSSKSFTFMTGAGDVIRGMDQGILGMKVGGRRKVTVPSSLGYGKRGSAPSIPPDSTLCFDIKLLRNR